MGWSGALAVCKAVAAELGCRPDQVLPFSTGVIMEPLPVDRIVAGLPAAMRDIRPDNWAAAAEAIMTTDTVAKAVSRTVRLAGGEATITGIAKGSGMIRPDMATMLGFVATDAKLSRSELQRMTKAAADQSFNAITVDGDTSTNDAFICLATGKGPVARSKNDIAALAEAVARLHRRSPRPSSATARVRPSSSPCASRAAAARPSAARSPTPSRTRRWSRRRSSPPTPISGASWRRSATPASTISTASKVDLYLDDVRVARGGGRDPAYREAQGAAVMQKAEITVRAVLNRGPAAATVWTCDLSYDYVKINAEYRS